MVDVRSQQPLPIDALIPKILGSLERSPNLVIEAEPGAGKTTRIPPALLGAGTGDVLVLEPRRIAARMAAKRVAWELGEEPGGTVGYQVRFERVAGQKTRLHFLTEGVMTRRLLSDPELLGVSTVVLDEFHERHLDTDLALALLRRLQQRRPDLRIVLMSATLDTTGVAHFLGDCPVLRSEGRLFDLSVAYTPYFQAPLQDQVKDAVEEIMHDEQAGDILVFLPGAAEIRQAARACEPVARAFSRIVLPLHSQLEPSVQDRAVSPSAQPKIILSTNVAESSITIDGVSTVIDSGLAREATYSQWTGLSMLRVSRISKASARQRAGRAARTGPGRVVRLYSQMDFERRAEFELPEIMRSDLTQLCLALRAMGVRDPRQIEWLETPTDQAIESAESLLDRLVTGEDDARKLIRLPLHPRLSRMIGEAMKRGAGWSACMTAALLGSGERTERNDLLEALDQPLGESARQQLRHLLRMVKPERPQIQDDDALLQALLVGFPDRVAQLKSGNQVMLANGTSAEILGQPPQFSFLLALDAEHRMERQLPQIRLFARVEPEWLLDHFSDQVREESALLWNRQAERVDAVSRLVYGSLVLQQSTVLSADKNAVGNLLADKALEAGIGRFVDEALLEDLFGRVEFIGLDAPDIGGSFREFCREYRSFAELNDASDGFIARLEQQFDGHQLNENAPRTLQLKGGRRVKIHYERGKAPWVASRLQDFFGMNESPRLGPKRTPVVLHLLAPNQRPVQTTTDLAGFWARLYPQVRRDLMRRYPRHAWPENHQKPPA
ncbi:MAG: ATP-dependent helicase C-terminal domain-containing protein [Acidobacteriaceae bacterium]